MKIFRLMFNECYSAYYYKNPMIHFLKLTIWQWIKWKQRPNKCGWHKICMYMCALHLEMEYIYVLLCHSINLCWISKENYYYYCSSFSATSAVGNQDGNGTFSLWEEFRSIVTEKYVTVFIHWGLLLTPVISFISRWPKTGELHGN